MADARKVNPIGAHTIDTTISASTTLTPTTGADVITIQPLTQNVRITFDGTTPTATTGFQMVASTIYVLDIAPNTVLKIIEETATASVQYQFGQSMVAQ
jgi:hypothetical protein